MERRMKRKRPQDDQVMIRERQTESGTRENWRSETPGVGEERLGRIQERKEEKL